jgi:MarR family 2-MHQ and catechol resistance regulon transcriptional repressor
MMELIRFYQFRDRNRAVRHGLTVAQCHVLDFLEDHGSASIGAIAAALYLDKSTTSRIVSGMLRRALVRRSTDPDDARGVLIAATARGRNSYRHVVRDIVGEDYAFFSAYPQSTRRRVIAVIERLTRLGVARDRTVTRSADDGR